MNKKEIKKSIELKIKDIGVKDAYKYLVIANAKVLKAQLKPLKTEYDKAMLVNLSHAITVKGFKDVGVMNRFSSLFLEDNVIFDEVWDYVFEDLIKFVDLK